MIHTLHDAWDLAVPTGLAALIATMLSTRRVLAWLRARQIMDMPNERSSHTLPTPRGGGLAVTPVVAVLLLLLALRLPLYPSLLGAGALALLAVSWLDDRKGLPPLPRFLAQGAVIALYLAGLDSQALAFQGVLPVWADRVAAGVAWLWFVNLYNFMDGIDGITGIETACVGLGIALAASAAGGEALNLVPPSVVVAAAGGAFLLFNWHPAKVFLGDSGSVPLGFVLGGLLIHLAVQGHLAAALILPAYYVADSTITLTRRAMAGEKVWQPHRKHFYQRAVLGGKSHDRVALAVLGGNVILIAAAVLSVSDWGMAGAAVAVSAVLGLLALLQVWSK